MLDVGGYIEDIEVDFVGAFFFVVGIVDNDINMFWCFNDDGVGSLF